MGLARNSASRKADVNELRSGALSDFGEAALLENCPLQRKLLREFRDLRIAGRLARLVIDYRSASIAQNVDPVGSPFQHKPACRRRDLHTSIDLQPGANNLARRLRSSADKPARRPQKARPPQGKRDLRNCVARERFFRHRN